MTIRIASVVLGVALSAMASPATQPSEAPVCHDSATRAPAFRSSITTQPSPRGDEAMQRGVDAYRQGKIEQAADAWRASADAYRDAGDWEHYCDAALRLAGAYEALGNYRLAMDVLCPLREEARARDPRQYMRLTAAIGRALCFTISHHDTVGDPAIYLNESLATARELNDIATEAAILNDLANLHAARGQVVEAQHAYEQSAKLAHSLGDSVMAARVRCNAALLDHPDRAASLNALSEASTAVDKLSPSLDQARLSILLACRFDQLDVEPKRAEQLFRRAIDLSKQFQDDRLAGFAWGYLGRHFEKLNQTDQAMIATRHARFASQKLQRDDSLYRWEWQLGRLHQKRGDIPAAIAAYQRAVGSLSKNNVRDDVALAYAAPVGGGNFRAQVGTLYYGLADLLLLQCDNETDPAKEQELLRSARDTIELFKAAELKNYFQDDCLKLAEASKAQIDSALRGSPRTAVIYIVPLPDRCEMLLTFAGASKSDRSVMWRAPKVAANDQEIAQLALTMRKQLEQARNHNYRAPAKKLHKLLIAPIMDELKHRNIDTLVFVPDGELRQISPAALYDESTEKFLIEDFAIGLMPGLSMSISGGAATRGDARLLAGGLSKARTIQVRGESVTFQELKNVPQELIDVAASYPKRSETLSNESFGSERLNMALEGTSFSIVHLATHANFDTDVRKTYVVTNDERPIGMNDLQQMIQPSQFRGQPVDLLTLSACETAAGDDDGRSAMGLAGIAVRAGARSALATLWLAHDAATSELIPDFYRELNSSTGNSKALALRAAQLKMINAKTYDHPRFWAHFVIIGNWQ
ncbi:MAG: CHAT domain-containing protein [Anaerolineae bacterium]|nr:CHAT domain-containing protein [Phycisphaerae bacterium]